MRFSVYNISYTESMEKMLTVVRPIKGNESFIEVPIPLEQNTLPYNLSDATLENYPAEDYPLDCYYAEAVQGQSTPAIIYRDKNGRFKDSNLSDGANAENVSENRIFRFTGQYFRRFGDKMRRVHTVEFPEIGRPLELFEFTYDAERMGKAPSINATAYWFDFLDGEWSQDCHVEFGGRRFYLNYIPSSSKSNEDARYKYDMVFVDERAALEHVYLYDVVTPSIDEIHHSESSVFSFFGSVADFARRVNASLVSSGLSEYVLKEGVSSYYSYTEWCEIPLSGTQEQKAIYNSHRGNYNAYLLGDVLATESDNVTPIIKGYKMVIGTDAENHPIKSEEKLIAVENNTIYEALQKIKEDFELQYYITYDEQGNTLITVGDCEHNFGDGNAFEYGADKSLLSIEKNNTTESIVTRCTGLGSGENLPWYYPNPTPDGWLRPVYKRNGEVDDTVEITTYTEASSGNDYDKYLKNRLGQDFVYGKEIDFLTTLEYKVQDSDFEFDSNRNVGNCYFTYHFSVPRNVLSFIELHAQWKVGTAKLEYGTSLESDDPLLQYFYGTLPYQSGTKIFSLTGEGITNNTLDIGQYFDINSGNDNMDVSVKFTINFTEAFAVILPYSNQAKWYFYPEREYQYDPEWSSKWETPFLEWLEPDKTSTFPAFLSTIPNLEWYQESKSYLGGTLYSRNVGYKYTKPDGTVVRIEVPLNEGTTTEYSIEYGTESHWYEGNNNDSRIVFPRSGTEICAWVTGSNEIIKYTWGDTPYSINDITGRYEWMPYVSGNNIYPRALTDTYAYYKVRSAVSASNLDAFLSRYFDFRLRIYYADGWYLNGTKTALQSYGITNESSFTPEVGDTIEFQRIKFVKTSPNLLPQLYIKTDGARRFYPAKNYFGDGHLLITGTPDTALGEEGAGDKVQNALYKQGEATNTHYVFENEYMQNRPMEHIEQYDDIKPTLKEQRNSSERRIDVVQEFAYDVFDDDTMWVSGGDSDNGEYKHPHFFAKLRPLGFNLFDYALTDEMILSITTGVCGSCKFKIKVDENTKKNPIQIWEYDVYEYDSDNRAYVLKYNAGDLKRYENTNVLYRHDNPADPNSSYVCIATSTYGSYGKESFEYDDKERFYKTTTYDAETITSGEVGVLEQGGKKHYEGDVVTSGRFIDSQQDTTSNYVWVILEKDLDTFGTIMPSCTPDYVSGQPTVSMRPKAIKDVHIAASTGVEESTNTADETNADKFVLTNIQMPTKFLRSAEEELSKAIIKTMYDKNYQKYNFTIKFSRIYLEQAKIGTGADEYAVMDKLNENSVLWVKYNKPTPYKQYVSHYTYKMSPSSVLPEITVSLKEELSIMRTLKEEQREENRRRRQEFNQEVGRRVDNATSQMRNQYVPRNGVTVVGGNIISSVGGISLNEVRRTIRDANAKAERIDDTVKSNYLDRVQMTAQYFDKNAFEIGDGSFAIGGTQVVKVADKTVTVANRDFQPAFLANNDGNYNADSGYFSLVSNAPNQNTSHYTELTTEPSNWATNYNDYYHNVSGSYIKNRYSSAPAFSSQTFYSGEIENSIVNLVTKSTVAANKQDADTKFYRVQESVQREFERHTWIVMDSNGIYHTVEPDGSWQAASSVLMWTAHNGQSVNYQDYIDNIITPDGSSEIIVPPNNP